MVGGRMPNLADKIMELEKEISGIQDETKRENLQRQIDELKTKYQSELENLQNQINKSEETTPLYFDRETDVLKGFYDGKDGERVNVDAVFGLIKRSFFDRLDNVNIFGRGYYGPDVKEAKEELREMVRKEALSRAKIKGYDAVLIKEDQKEDVFCFKVLNAVPKEGGAKITFRASSDIYFYKKKENAATNQ